MSKESALAYLEKLAEDADFQKKVASAPNDEARWDMVKEAGFDFTKEELIEVMQEKSGRKLSDAELEQVTGGGAAAIRAAASIVAAAIVKSK